ncbi:hypothetical protein SAMN02927916_2126 [Flavobacterium anhuiense]|jgi:hypothetical protein|uniref:Uncharacterized protein n=1 Tax=Flavobacterium anhuiense TaxID=459526 RepID=A0ABY0LNZ7_9FLAO|nr:hypothetical protein SAMN02927916_2126 [Flavobacterium anhuiense]
MKIGICLIKYINNSSNKENNIISLPQVHTNKYLTYQNYTNTENQHFKNKKNGKKNKRKSILPS